MKEIKIVDDETGKVAAHMYADTAGDLINQIVSCLCHDGDGEYLIEASVNDARSRATDKPSD